MTNSNIIYKNSVVLTKNIIVIVLKENQELNELNDYFNKKYLNSTFLNDQLQINVFIILNSMLMFIFILISKCFVSIKINSLFDYIFIFLIFIPVGFNQLIKLSLILKNKKIIDKFKKFINKVSNTNDLLKNNTNIIEKRSIETNYDFNIINSECLFELGSVKNIIFTKNKLFTNKSFIINSIVTEEHYSYISFKDNSKSENSEVKFTNIQNPKSNFNNIKTNKTIFSKIDDSNHEKSKIIKNRFISDEINNFEVEEKFDIASIANTTHSDICNTISLYEKALQTKNDKNNQMEILPTIKNAQNKNESSKSKNTINLLNDNNNKIKNLENSLEEKKDLIKDIIVFKLKIEELYLEKGKDNLSNYIYFNNMKEILNLVILLIDLSILSRDKNYNDKTDNHLDKVIIEFVSNFGIRIQKIKSTKESIIGFEVIIQNGEENTSYIVIALDEYSEDLKIVYLNQKTNEINLIIRCSHKRLKQNYLGNISNNEYIDQITKQNKSKNSESLFYLHKILTQNEINIWDNLFKKLSEKIIEKNELFISFLSSLEKENKFFFFFGFGYTEDYLNNSIFFKEILDSGIKISHLSKQNFNSTMSFVHKNNILESSTEKSIVLQIKINTTNKEKGMILFKESCESFEKFIKSKKNNLKNKKPEDQKSDLKDNNNSNKINDDIVNGNVLKNPYRLELFVSAKSLPMILSEPYFYYNFKVFLDFSDVFIAYNISKENISQILSIFNTLYSPRQNILISKEENVYQYNNILLNPSMNIHKHYIADIYLNNINILKFLMFKKGLIINKSIVRFRNLISTITNINFFCYFTLKVLNLTYLSIVDYYFPLYLFQHMIMIITSFFIFSFCKLSNSVNKLNFSLIYKMNLFKINFELKTSIFFMLSGTLIGTLIVLGHYFISSFFINDMSNLVHLIFFTISTSIIILFFLISIKNRIINLLMTTSILILVLAILHLKSIFSKNVWNIKNFVYYLYDNKSFYNSLIVYSSIVFLIFSFYKKFLKYSFTFEQYLLANKNNINLREIENIENRLNKYNYKSIIFQNKVYRLTPNIKIIDSSITNIFYTGEINNDSIYIDFLSLKFSDKKLQKYSENHFLFKADYKFIKEEKILILTLIVLSQILKEFISYSRSATFDYTDKILLYFFIVCLIFKSFFIKKQSLNIIINFLNSAIIVFSYNIFYHSSNFTFGIYFIYYFYYLQLLQNNNVLITFFTLSVYSLIFVLLHILIPSKINYLQHASIFEKVKDIFFLFVSLVIYNIYNFILNHKSNSLKINNFFVKLKLNSKKNYNNELINLLMPKFVLSRISFDLKENCLAEDAGNVAIIFVEICNFNLILTHYKENIIMFLDQLFKDFDNQCEKFGIQKIETVGKTYLAATGIIFMESKLNKNIRAMNPVHRIFEFALSLIKIAEMYHYGNANKIVIKIGIHQGKATMGVLGYHKPQFSLIGDTINTTSRLCTTGDSGHIMISTDTFEKIKNIVIEYKLVIKEVDTPMKGKGVVKVVHVFRKGNIMKNKIIALAKKLIEFGRKESFKGNNIMEIIKLDSNLLCKDLPESFGSGMNKSDSEIPINFTLKEITAITNLNKFDQTNDFILFMKCMQILRNFNKNKEKDSLPTNIKLLDNIQKEPYTPRNHESIKKEPSIDNESFEDNFEQKRKSLIKISSKEQECLEEFRRKSVELNSKFDIGDDDSEFNVD